MTTLTGPVPGLFEAAEYGLNAFAAYINTQGGICGRKLVFDIADDDLDASQNQAAVQSLGPNVFAFVGSFSGVDQGGASTLQSDGIPDVGESVSPQRSALPTSFSPEPVPCGINLAPYEYYKQKFPNAIAHMAVLSLNQPTDLYETECQQAALESIGYQFVYSDKNIALTQNNFSSDAQAMKGAGVEGVIMVATAAYYAEVATAAQNAGLNMQLPLYNPNIYDPTFIAQAGSGANGAISASPLEMYQGQDASSNPTIATFDKYYQAISGGNAPNEFGVWAWLAGMLFIAGLNAGGGLTRGDLLSGLSKVTSFDGGGMQGPTDPAAKTASSCWLALDVVNQKYARDPSSPSTGLTCPSSNTYDTITNIPLPS